MDPARDDAEPQHHWPGGAGGNGPSVNPPKPTGPRAAPGHRASPVSEEGRQRRGNDRRQQEGDGLLGGHLG
ncbi:MAG: hypothetical protein ACK54K_02825, partial [Gemmatimonadaceae bacterium]